ncbi:MAG TPA: hypothetical protein VJB70_01925 [Candidatus Paceibacterota bacterium]
MPNPCVFITMLAYNEIKPKKFIILDGEPYEVLSSWVFRKQQRKPVNQTKLRNIKTGKVTEHSFHQAETVVEADIQTKKVMYLFQKPSRDRSQNEFWFHENENPAARFTLTQEKLGINPLFLKQNAPVDALVFADEIIGISLPIKLTLMVTEAPPSIRGSTAQGGNKVATLETGATVAVPLFVNEGDQIVINTESGEYVERAEKN